MLSDTTFLGHPIHLVLEDADGRAFEVLGAFSFPPEGIKVDQNRVLRAISEHTYGPMPAQRSVEFKA